MSDEASALNTDCLHFLAASAMDTVLVRLSCIILLNYKFVNKMLRKNYINKLLSVINKKSGDLNNPRKYDKYIFNSIRNM